MSYVFQATLTRREGGVVDRTFSAHSMTDALLISGQILRGLADECDSVTVKRALDIAPNLKD